MIIPLNITTHNIVNIDDEIFLVRKGNIYDAFSRGGKKLGILEKLDTVDSKMHFYIQPEYITGKVWGIVRDKILLEVEFN